MGNGVRGGFRGGVEGVLRGILISVFIIDWRVGSRDGSADFEGCKLLIFSRLTILESADPFKFKGVGG